MRSVSINLYSLSELRTHGADGVYSRVLYKFKCDLAQVQSDEYQYCYSSMCDFLRGLDVVTYEDLHGFCHRSGDACNFNILDEVKPWHGARKIEYVLADLKRAANRADESNQDRLLSDASTDDVLEYADSLALEFTFDGNTWEEE